MIGRAVQLLDLHRHDENFHRLSDDLLLAALANSKVADALGLKLTKDKDRRTAAEEVGKLVGDRRLYKLAYLGVADDDVNAKAEDLYARWGDDADARQQLEERLAAMAGVKSGHVLVHMPTPEMMAKLAKVRVLLEDDTVISFETWDGRHSRRVQALNEAHQRLWRLAVYLHPDDALDSGKRRLVAGAARDLFGLRSRYAEPETNEPYFATVFDLHVTHEEWPAGEREEIIRDAARAAAKSADPDTLQSAVETLRAVVAARAAAEEDEGEAPAQGSLPGTA